ncbi:MAG: GNAT family N-acetyltransferase [Anaerolineaceae bacterium]
MNAIIRSARASDFEQIHILAEQIHQLHVDHRPDIYASIDPLSQAYFDLLIHDPDTLALAAEVDLRVVGFCVTIIRPPSGNPLTVPHITAYMDTLCVDEDYHRLGIGKMLFDAAAQQAKLRGAVRLELHVAAFNQTAIRFYEHLGLSVKNLAMEIEI